LEENNMRMVGFRIRDYKSIVDSGCCELAFDITGFDTMKGAAP